MKKISILVFVMSFFAVVGTVSAEANKAVVCHMTGSENNPVVMISVSGNAIGSHLEHGDSLYLPDENGVYYCEGDVVVHPE